MKKSENILRALHSYKRDMRRLKTYYPNWETIPLKEYIQRHYKKLNTT